MFAVNREADAGGAPQKGPLSLAFTLVCPHGHAVSKHGTDIFFLLFFCPVAGFSCVDFNTFVLFSVYAVNKPQLILFI